MFHRIPLPFHLLLAAALASTPMARAADDTTNSIKFSDPAKPGTVRISIGRGDLRIQGSDTNEVTVKSEARPVNTKRKDGLREISVASGFSLTEKDNVVTLDSASHEWGSKRAADYQLTVPRSTTVIVQNAWGGDITCGNLSGDIEVNSMNGKITLEDVAGGVVCSTMNGEIRANIRDLREGKPLSFTSMNGEIQIRLPETAKANVRLRTQHGAVLTDFEETALVTTAETTPSARRPAMVWAEGGSTKVLTREIQDAIREATAASATAVREALEAVRQGLDESRLNSEDARRQLEDARRQIERARRDADRARAEAERERRPVARSGGGEAPAAPTAPAVAASAPRPPIPPKVAVPTISGGKLVTGTLNGGGPEISVSTMNGDVVLRKLGTQ